MAKAIRFYETGGPEVLTWEAAEVGDPGAGEVRVRHHAVGLNFADTYFRSGLYPAQLPAGMGVEGAGVIEAVGNLDNVEIPVLSPGIVLATGEDDGFPIESMQLVQFDGAQYQEVGEVISYEGETPVAE